jgi:hypothetical protein
MAQGANPAKVSNYLVQKYFLDCEIENSTPYVGLILHHDLVLFYDLS